MGLDDLFGDIYEAAFLPELWPGVLMRIAEASQSSSGVMLIVAPHLPPLFSATPNSAELLAEFAATPAWYHNTRLETLVRLGHAGFLVTIDHMSESDKRDDRVADYLEDLGFASQVGSVIAMPEGEQICFSFERRDADAFASKDLIWFDRLRPHLARASLMAAQLQMEKARAGTAAMQALGIPAAVVAGNGAVMATNAAFEGLSHLLRPAARGRISIANKQTDQLLQTALSASVLEGTAPVRSFPMRMPEGDSIVVHVLPLHRGATDLFSRGAAMVVVTGYSADANVPADAVPRGLFDLSAAEAAVASGVARGLAPHEIAAERGVSITTIRSHLAQIFRKTGTSQQSQLVALLKGITMGPKPE